MVRMGELETHPQFKSAIGSPPLDLCMYGVAHVSGQLSFPLNRLLSILSFLSPFVEHLQDLSPLYQLPTSGCLLDALQCPLDASASGSSSSVQGFL